MINDMHCLAGGVTLGSNFTDIWMAETRKAAETALDAFIETYGIKYEKAVECLTKDRDALFAFYDFPAEHWKHLRTTTRSKARSRPFDIGRFDQGDVFRTRPRWP